MTLNQAEIPAWNYEKIIQDIAFNKPKNIKVSSMQGTYYKGDTSYEITLQNGNQIIARIWESHMSVGSENQTLAEQGKIFISAYLIEGEEKSHLPLYGWYNFDDYEGIWSKILEK